jgi:hypothetical protein
MNVVGQLHAVAALSPGRYGREDKKAIEHRTFVAWWSQYRHDGWLFI